MSRWEPDARGRLERAALDLYQERGFEQTTVTEIAERAGLTERTFFRHFADKREVLFGGQEELLRLYVAAIETAPESAAPLEAVLAALEAAVPLFRERRALVRQRQAVIDATPGLREREMLKRASLARGMTEALTSRGLPEPEARLAAELGALIFGAAFAAWAAAPEELELASLIRRAYGTLKDMMGGAGAPGPEGRMPGRGRPGTQEDR